MTLRERVLERYDVMTRERGIDHYWKKEVDEAVKYLGQQCGARSNVVTYIKHVSPFFSMECYRWENCEFECPDNPTLLDHLRNKHVDPQVSQRMSRFKQVYFSRRQTWDKTIG